MFCIGKKLTLLFFLLITVLVVRVTDSGGLVHPDSPATMSDNVFGTGTDQVNLKSQMEACSFGKLNMTAGNRNYTLPSAIEPAPGVIEVDIDVSSATAQC